MIAKAFVLGGDFSPLWSAILFVIMKSDRLNTPPGIHTRVPPALRSARRAASR
jgi:hypothetical protein